MKFKNIDENKKKNLKIYLIFLISFLVFSIYGFMKFNGNTKEKINNSKSVKCNLEDESNNENESKPIEQIGSDYKNKSIDIVKRFLKSYHLIESTKPINEFEKVKDIVADQLYLELEHEVVGNASVPNKGLIYRTIEDMKVYDYTFDDESKEIHVKADIHSNWLNENKQISLKNELTKYDFLITNFSGDWKISQITTEIY
ncbi:hypothetical protein [Paraclostridium sordellii]|uniref:hypothetical protein n=1 Tax=Paraclostridium sordellii TaxID=1505 RepID=UPI000E522996|nr:hypothetical protein [Paeniclostridium sordellii]RGX06268.1 hypothetical protein DWV40_11505 [Paeniclostridium sordellii]